jgi:hypothetical protein
MAGAPRQIRRELVRDTRIIAGGDRGTRLLSFRLRIAKDFVMEILPEA